MRAAVLSDIHANLPALRAVLADIEAEQVDEIWCLGDIVGYGAHPRECLDLVMERCEIRLLGNHDLAAMDRIDISTFSRPAAEAAIWTHERLGPAGIAELEEIEFSAAERDGIGLCHASPRDPVWEYVIDSEIAADNLKYQATPVSLVGHSHIALHFSREIGHTAVQGLLGHEGMQLPLAGREWLINPGSTGQPRDGNPKAAWGLIDTDEQRFSYRRTEYPISAAAEAILVAGLPRELAERLFIGR